MKAVAFRQVEAIVAKKTYFSLNIHEREMTVQGEKTWSL